MSSAEWRNQQIAAWIADEYGDMDSVTFVRTNGAGTTTVSFVDGSEYEIAVTETKPPKDRT